VRRITAALQSGGAGNVAANLISWALRSPGRGGAGPGYVWRRIGPAIERLGIGLLGFSDWKRTGIPLYAKLVLAPRN